MPKSKKLDEALALLDSIRPDPTSPQAQTILKNLLQSKQSIPAANAAKLIGDADLRELIPTLIASFPYWLEDPIVRDPGCFAKFRITETLYKLEIPNEEIFLQGIRHHQLEPTWAGKQDTACSLRNVSALGLVKCGYSELMLELADLLADSEPSVRSGAIRAIAYSGRIEAIPLLRYKTQIGDKELSVLADSFAALLEIDPQNAIPVVAKHLVTKPQITESGILDTGIAEMAALALGESKLPAAYPLLERFYQETVYAELKKSALLAIAMHRSQPALTFLKDLLRNGSITNASEALEALKLYQSDSDLWEIIEMIVEARGDDRLLRQLHQPEATL
jgi:hypothetical protein